MSNLAWPVSIALFLNRLALGLLIFFAGWKKVFVMGVENFYQKGFVAMKPAWLPDWFGWPYGHAVPFIELILGAMLVAGFFSRTAALLTFFAIGSFTVAHWQAGELFAKGPIHPNFIMLTLSLLLAMTGPGRISLDAIWGAKLHVNVKVTGAKG